MVRILNLTQHKTTAEQAGFVVDLDDAKTVYLQGQDEVFGGDNGADFLTRYSTSLNDILTFDEIPSTEEMVKRAEYLTNLAKELSFSYVMIGGAPFFMEILANSLRARSITPVYAFSKRVSVDSIQQDGTVVKTSVFKHVGFVGLN